MTIFNEKCSLSIFSMKILPTAEKKKLDTEVKTVFFGPLIMKHANIGVCMTVSGVTYSVVVKLYNYTVEYQDDEEMVAVYLRHQKGYTGDMYPKIRAFTVQILKYRKLKQDQYKKVGCPSFELYIENKKLDTVDEIMYEKTDSYFIRKKNVFSINPLASFESLKGRYKVDERVRLRFIVKYEI